MTGIGYRSGMLVVTSSPRRRDDGRFVVRIRCDCGVEKEVRVDQLQGKRAARTCGCTRRDLRRESYGKVHGQTGTKEHNAWREILRRCEYTDAPSRRRYKLVSVEEKWKGKDGFSRFLAHIGKAPSPKHTVDRIDNSKGYEPGNVRWATRREQAINRGSTRFLSAFGKTQCMKDWAREVGIGRTTIAKRLSSGWTTEEALTLEASPLERRYR